MYIDFETYRQLGGTIEDESVFEAWEPVAEDFLDAWTLDRLQVIDWSDWQDQVHRVMVRLVDNAERMQDEAASRQLASFSNGQDSYGFRDDGGEGATCRACHSLAVRVLPIQLMSCCATYNHAYGAEV